MIELSLFEQTGRLSVYQWTAYLLPLCHFTAAALNAALDWLARLVTDEKEDWDLRLCAANTLLDFPRASYRPLLEALAVRQKEPDVHFTNADIEEAYVAGRDKLDWLCFENTWQ